MRLSLVAVFLSNKVTGVLRGADVRHEEFQHQTDLNDVEEETNASKNHGAEEAKDTNDKAVSEGEQRSEDHNRPDSSGHEDKQHVDEGGELQGDKAAEGEIKQRLEEARALRRTTVLCGLLRVLIVLRRGSKGRVLLAESLLLLCPEALLALGAEALLLLRAEALLLVTTKAGRGVGVRSRGAEAITRLLPKTLALVGFCLRSAAKAVVAKAAVAVTVVAVALIRVRRLSGVLGTSTAIGVVGSVGGAKRVMVSAGIMVFRLAVS